MGIRFVLLVNKQGQTRLAQYYEYLTLEERRALEGEIVRKCLARTEQQVLFPLLINPMNHQLLRYCCNIVHLRFSRSV